MRHRVPAAAVLVIVGILAAGAAVLGIREAGPVRPTNAASFARQVLAEATVPPGGHPTAEVCTMVKAWMSDTSTPGVGGITQLHRRYLYDEPAATVARDIRAHVPVGATITSTGMFTDLAFTLTESLPLAGRHEDMAELEYVAAPATAHCGTSELSVRALTVWVPTRPADERAPLHGTVAVTGFRAISIARGSSGPVTVTLGPRRARAVLRAFDELGRAPRAFCMEGSRLFTVTVHPAGDRGRSLVATETACAASVSVVVDGRPGPDLADRSCALLSAVASALPPSAAGTRRAVADCRRARPSWRT